MIPNIEERVAHDMVPLAELQAERRRKQAARREIARIKDVLEAHGVTLEMDANGNLTFTGGSGHGE